MEVDYDKITINLTYSPKLETLRRKFGNLPIYYIRTKIDDECDLRIMEMVVRKYKFNLIDDEVTDEMGIFDDVEDCSPTKRQRLSIDDDDDDTNEERALNGNDNNEENDGYHNSHDPHYSDDDSDDRDSNELPSQSARIDPKLAFNFKNRKVTLKKNKNNRDSTCEYNRMN